MKSLGLKRLQPDLILFFGILVLSGLFFHAAPGWNVNSRFALTRAITEYGRLSVDEVLAKDPAMETQDLSRWQNRLYSDKTPGVSFLAVPAALVVRGAEFVLGPVSTPTRRYWVTLGSCGLALAGFAIVMRRLITRLLRAAGGQQSPEFLSQVAALGALATVITTPAFYYGTLLMSYAPMLLFLGLGVLVVLVATEEDSGEKLGRVPAEAATEVALAFPSLQKLFGLALLAGIWGGLAVLMEYIAAMAVGFVGLFGLLRIFVSNSPQLLPRLTIFALAYGVGVILGWAPFVLYALGAFGTVTIPYAFHANDMFRVHMARGFMGIDAPNPTVFYLITLHPFRGLFVQAPWLGMGALWGVGLILGFVIFGKGGARVASVKEQVEAQAEKGESGKSSAIVGPGIPSLDSSTLLWVLLSVVVLVAYLLFNAGYYMWWGGWSFAPRHLVPVIPFMGALGALAWVRGGLPLRVALGMGLAWGFLIHFTVMATDPQVPDVGWAGGTTLARLLSPQVEFMPPWPWARQVLPRLGAGQTSTLIGSGWWGLAIPLLITGAVVWLVVRRPGKASAL